MDGVLLVDKPQGLTSHDVVAAARRLLAESRIGHTGTLDPLATGLLPLAIGQATRLVRFLTSSDKDYDAVIRFGLTTDSYDVTGTETSRTDAVPREDAVVAGLRTLTGDYLQMPPAFSAKKIQGRRAYELARQDRQVALTAVPVHVERADLVAFSDGRARVAVTCSAGFYVRSFAHALGEHVGTGACLETLRRTRSGDFTLDRALSLEALAIPAQAASRLIPLNALLGGFAAVRVSDRGREYVAHGRELDPGDYIETRRPGSYGPGVAAGPEGPALRDAGWVRLLDDTGALVAIATAGRAPGSLHPSVVLI